MIGFLFALNVGFADVLTIFFTPAYINNSETIQ